MEINKVGQSDAFPWLSVDGLRLYYTKQQEIVVASRLTLQAVFNAPHSVPGLPVGFFSAWLTPAEDTCLLIDNQEFRLWESYRTIPSAVFTAPVPIALTGYPDSSFKAFGPSRSASGKELMLMISNGQYKRLARFVRSGPTSFAFTRHLPLPFEPSTGQLFDHDLGYLLTGGDSSQKALYMLRRPTLDSSFGPPIPLEVPALRYKLHPAYQSGIDILVFTSSAAFDWEENDLFITEHFSGILSRASAFDTATFTLTPNPTHRTVRLTGAPVGPVTLLDAVGRTVRTLTLAAGQANARLSVEGLPAGLYTVRAGQQTRRLVVE